MTSPSKPLPQPLDARAHAGDGDGAAREAGAIIDAEVKGSCWVFTFGSGTPLARYYVVIDAESEMQARARMIGMFSQSWAGCYTWDDFTESGQAERFNMLQLQFNKNATLRLKSNAEDMPPDLYRLAYPWD